LPTWLFKKGSHVVAPYLAALINLSISSSVFPSGMKQATVVPLLKKNNLNVNDIRNYRPVSNLSFISKILEKVVSKLIMKYIEDHELISGRPSAYRIYI